MENSLISDSENCLVKQVLHIPVVSIEVNVEVSTNVYKQKLTQVSIWSDDELNKLDAGESL
jgi:hypothetical protein